MTTKKTKAELLPSETKVKMHVDKPTSGEIAEKNLRFAIWAKCNHSRLNNYSAPYYLNSFVDGCSTYVNTGINKKVFDTRLMETQINDYYGKSNL